MTEASETSVNSAYLSAINEQILTPVVCQALDLDNIAVNHWNYSRVYGGAGDVGDVLSGVYRFVGKARNQEMQVDWSLILKVVGTTAEEDDPTDVRYWKREVLAYQSGQLTNLSGNLAAPRYFGAIKFSEKVIGLWLEDLADQVGPKWPLEQYGIAAQHLGQFNGSFLMDQTLPPWPWLLRDRFHGFIHGEQVGKKFDQLRQSLDDPQTRRWFLDDDDIVRILQLWENRAPLLQALNHLPQTIVHGDAFRRNLFAGQSSNGNPQTVAIDWTFVGVGAIGFELVSLVQGTLFFSEVAMVDAQALDQIVFEGYITGLRDVGWQGDPKQVRLGYTIGSAIVFGLGYGAFKLNPNTYPWLEQAFGLPIDQFMKLGAELNHFFLALADEARKLLN